MTTPLESKRDLHQARDALIRWFLSQELSNEDAMAVMTAASLFFLDTFRPKDIESYITKLTRLSHG